MIAVIDYNAGNVCSVLNALERLGVDAVLTNDAEQIRNADKIIFPGQGSAAQGMASLQALGLVEVLKEAKQPFLGICLGMQLLYDWSEEGDTKMLGIIPGEVRRFQGELPVPQMGWNVLKTCGESPLMKGLEDESYLYFVHSYAAEVDENCQALAFYDGPFAALVQKDNFYGAQFHPEKSGEVGEKILLNFLKL